MAMQWFNQGYFQYGETGNRITGLKESELFQGSAHTVVNFNITELGTLKVSKKFSATPLNISEDVLEVIDTPYFFVVLVTANYVYTLNKYDNTILHNLHHNGGFVKIKSAFFKDTIYVNNYYFWVNKGTGEISYSTFKDTIKLPMKNAKKVFFDLYKVMKVGSDDRLALLKTFEDANMKTDGSGKISLVNTDMTIKRFYKDFKSIPAIEDFDGLVTNDVIAIFQDYKVAHEGSDYYFGDTQVTFTGSTMDNTYKGEYFTGATANLEGTFRYGEIIDFKNYIVDMIVFQNRLVIATNDTLFFSKVFDYNNFKNGTNNDDAFYLKPSVINNAQPNILKLDASLGIYATTDRGVFLIGYNIGMTPKTSTSAIKIAIDIPATENTVIIDDLFYFIDFQGTLRGVQAVYTTGVLSFVKSEVEKYSIVKDIRYISKTTVDNRSFLIASTESKDKMYLYTNIDGNMFRRVTQKIDYETYLIGTDHFMISKRKLFKETNINQDEAYLFFNPPLLQTKNGGTLLNDFNSRIKRISVNLLNENRQGVKKVYLNEVGVNNLSSNVRDTFSVYKIETSVPVLDGYSIKITTEENEKHIEVKIISLMIDVQGG